MSKPRTIAIVGGGGFLGTWLARDLSAPRYGARLRLIDTAFGGDKEVGPVDAERIQCDIRDASAVSRALFGCETVFHKAALLGIPGRATSIADAQEYIMTNLMGTRNVLEACREHGVRTLVMDSSKEVFGGATEGYLASEKTTPHPGSFYGVSKLLAENLVRMYHERHGIGCTVLRYSRVRSAASPDVITAFLRAVYEGRPVRIFGNPFKEIDFIDISDVVRSNILAMKRTAGFATFHISSGQSLRVVDIAMFARELFGRPAHPIVFEEGTNRDMEPTRNLLDISKAAEILGYRPQVSVAAMIRSSFDLIRGKAGGE